MLTVSLAADSTILTDDAIVLRSNVFSYHGQVADSTIEITSIKRECSLTAPIIHFQSSTEIGVCDDLVLDIRDQTISNLGARQPSSIEWRVAFDDADGQRNQTVYDAASVRIAASEILAGQSIAFALTVTSWYDRNASVNGTVYKSNLVQPSIELSFPAVVNASSAEMRIESAVTFSDASHSATRVCRRRRRRFFDIHGMSSSPRMRW